MEEDFEIEFHDTEFEEMVKATGLSSYREKDLLKMSRSVDKFGNKWSAESCHVVIGIITQDDFFKLYSNRNLLHVDTLKMMARLIKAISLENQERYDLKDKPYKEILKEIEQEIEDMG